MADRNTLIRGSQIRKGQGLDNDASNLLRVKVEANEGIKLDGDGLGVAYDNATIGIVSNLLAVKAGGILESHLDIESAPTDGYLLYYNDASGVQKLDYIDPATLVTGLTGAVLESDIINNEVPTGDINGANTQFELAFTPETNSVMVFLNGLLQQPTLDYSVESGETVTFVIAPDTSDILLVCYIKAS
jgi:hypothetical protein